MQILQYVSEIISFGLNGKYNFKGIDSSDDSAVKIYIFQ